MWRVSSLYKGCQSVHLNAHTHVVQTSKMLEADVLNTGG